MSNQEKLYQYAVSKLGRDASPKDEAPDELACADSVHEIVKGALGWEIGGGVSTQEQYKFLLKDKRFEVIDHYEYGCILTSPTGYGKLKHGHVGITGRNRILSNSSQSGTWEQDWTFDTWTNYFKSYGGFPIIIFKPIG